MRAAYGSTDAAKLFADTSILFADSSILFRDSSILCGIASQTAESTVPWRGEAPTRRPAQCIKRDDL